MKKVDISTKTVDYRGRYAIMASESGKGCVCVAMIRCRACGKDVSGKASACVYCGCPDFADGRMRKRLGGILQNSLSEPDCAAEESGRVCPECGRHTGACSDVCVFCGCPLDDLPE